MNSHTWPYLIKKWNSPDSEQNYNNYNSGLLNYSKDEIDYCYNYQGFRCDDFSLNSDFPILYLGCSLTEGEGLPLSEVWSYHLHQKIQESTKKNIPFWSLGKGGTSIDYAARMYYKFHSLLKPKYVFYLLSGISRREFRYDKSDYQNWFPNHTKLFKPNEGFKTVSLLFSDPEFSLYQTERSLTILNLLCTVTNAKFFIFDLNIDAICQEEKLNLFSKFDKINFIPIPSDKWNLNLSLETNLEIPEHIKKRPLKARDNSHPGALWQYKIYNFMWKNIHNNF